MIASRVVAELVFGEALGIPCLDRSGAKAPLSKSDNYGSVFGFIDSLSSGPKKSRALGEEVAISCHYDFLMGRWMKLSIGFRTRDPREKFQVYFWAPPTGICMVTQRALCPVLAMLLGINVLEEIGHNRTDHLPGKERFEGPL